MAVIFGSSGGGSSGAIYFVSNYHTACNNNLTSTSDILHSRYVHMQNLKAKYNWKYKIILQNAYNSKSSAEPSQDCSIYVGR